MILLTRFNGPAFALNPDLIERVEQTPDTVVTLVDGTKYVVAESVAEFIELVRQYRASVIAAAQERMSPTGRTRRPPRPERTERDTPTDAKVVPINAWDR